LRYVQEVVMTSSAKDSYIVETETFEAFFRREYRPVLGLAIALNMDRWTAEDVTQEAFAEAQRHWSRVGTLDRPAAWVRRVVANKSVSLWRRVGAEAKALRRLPNLENPAPDPELSAETVEVLDAVRSLPKRQAQVLALTYVEGLTTTEVGKVLGCSTATVKTHLQRGRAGVARHLGVKEER
jgi:RNA polymerase sigma-70 factor (ECF subfamily)